MLARLSYLAKSNAKFNLFSKVLRCHNQVSNKFYSKPSTPVSAIDIIDVDCDKMMYEDDDLDLEPKLEITSKDLDGVTIAPIDVNPWADEEIEKEGTFDMEYIEKSKEEIHYPEPPADRSGNYEFEGIQIWLPKRMLTPATYRYRLNDDEQQTLPDDIRICKFEHFKPSSSS